MERADLAARGSHPDAAFGLDVVDGFYTGGGHDVLVKPSASKGGHGFDPARRALHSSFMMAGPAVHKRGGRRDPHDADRADAGVDPRRQPFAGRREANRPVAGDECGTR